jgi:myo-inositol 2-dehydrogenase/D-chiro-inositol 1-dehydrogenase
MLRFGLLGAGRMGRVHAANLAANGAAELAWVYDVSDAAARDCAGQHGASTASSIDQVLNDRTVDAVLIASSTDTHAALIAASIRAGKAVFCEKPIDLDIGRVEQCRQQIRGREDRVMIGFQRRFDPSLRALHDRLRAGEVGTLHQVIATSRDTGIPPAAYIRVSGGLLRDMTIHDFDFARFLLGEEPVRIVCLAAAMLAPEVREAGDHDVALIVMQTTSGAQYCINNHRLAPYGCDQRIEAMGELGMLKVENQLPTTTERWAAAGTAMKDPLGNSALERYREAYKIEIDAFIAALGNGGPLPVTFEDGRRALLLANAAYQSLRTGRVVEIPTA